MRHPIALLKKVGAAAISAWRSVRLVVALLIGESILTFGLWLAWPPLGPISLGAQIVAGALLRESGDDS